MDVKKNDLISRFSKKIKVDEGSICDLLNFLSSNPHSKISEEIEKNRKQSDQVMESRTALSPFFKNLKLSSTQIETLNLLCEDIKITQNNFEDLLSECKYWYEDIKNFFNAAARTYKNNPLTLKKYFFRVRQPSSSSVYFTLYNKLISAYKRKYIKVKVDGISNGKESIAAKKERQALQYKSLKTQRPKSKPNKITTTVKKGQVKPISRSNEKILKEPIQNEENYISSWNTRFTEEDLTWNEDWVLHRDLNDFHRHIYELIREIQFNKWEHIIPFLRELRNDKQLLIKFATDHKIFAKHLWELVKCELNNGKKSL